MSATPGEQRRELGILAVGITTLAWAFPPLIIKESPMAPLAFAAYRLWAGVAIYAVLFLVTKRRLPWATIKACALGGVLFAADVAFAFTAFRLASVAEATIIGSLSTITIMIGAARWFGERLQRRDLGFIGASILGAGLVTLGSSGSPTFNALGDVAAVVSVFTWTTYWLYSKRAREGIGALEYMATVMLVAAIVMTVAAPLTGASMAWPSQSDWVAIFTVAVVAGAIGHSLIAWAHEHVEAWLASLILNALPVASVLLAWLLLDQGITPLTAVGGAIVLLCTGVLVIRQARRHPEDFEAEPPNPTV